MTRYPFALYVVQAKYVVVFAIMTLKCCIKTSCDLQGGSVWKRKYQVAYLNNNNYNNKNKNNDVANINNNNNGSRNIYAGCTLQRGRKLMLPTRVFRSTTQC